MLWHDWKLINWTPIKWTEIWGAIKRRGRINWHKSQCTMPAGSRNMDGIRIVNGTATMNHTISQIESEMKIQVHSYQMPWNCYSWNGTQSKAKILDSKELLDYRFIIICTRVNLRQRWIRVEYIMDFILNLLLQVWWQNMFLQDWHGFFYDGMELTRISAVLCCTVCHVKFGQRWVRSRKHAFSPLFPSGRVAIGAP